MMCIKCKAFRMCEMTKSADVVCICSTSEYWPRREKTCLLGFANNIGADQPAHSRSLISAFVIRSSEEFNIFFSHDIFSLAWK